MTDDLFNEPDKGTEPPKDDQTQENLVETLVGEGKKFADFEGLAKGKVEADGFIERLKQENEELRHELDKRAKLGDMVDRLETLQKNRTEDHDNAGGHPPAQGDDKVQSPEQLNETIEKLLSEREQKASRQKNISEARSHIEKTFGEDWQNKLKTKATELGVDPSWLNDVAGRSPKALYNILGMNGATTATQYSPPQSQKTEFNSGPTERTRSYYNELKKNNPKEYFSPRVQNQLHKDAVKLGEKFFDV